MLRSMAMKKKKKIKTMYRDKFRERLLKEKKRYKKKKSLMKRKHEHMTRRKYLNDARDESFTMGEWQTMHPEFLLESNTKPGHSEDSLVHIPHQSKA